MMNLNDYKTEMATKCADAWKLAQEDRPLRNCFMTLQQMNLISVKGIEFMSIHPPGSWGLHTSLLDHLLDRTK